MKNIRMESKHEKPKNRPKLPPTAAMMAAKSYKRISVKMSISELPCMYQISVEFERLLFIYINRTCKYIVFKTNLKKSVGYVM